MMEPVQALKVLKVLDSRAGGRRYLYYGVPRQALARLEVRDGFGG